MYLIVASKAHMWYNICSFSFYDLGWLFISFVLLVLFPVDVIHLIEMGEIVLASSCPVTPNYPIFVFSCPFGDWLGHFSLSVFWTRKNISIKICSLPGAKWLGYSAGCRSDKERFWTISNFPKADISLSSSREHFTQGFRCSGNSQEWQHFQKLLFEETIKSLLLYSAESCDAAWKFQHPSPFSLPTSAGATERL